MRIDPKSELYGLPALVVRKVLRNFPGDTAWRHWKHACRHVQPKEAAWPLIAALLADGLIEPGPDREGEKNKPPKFFCKTEKGMRLAQARARTLKRATATRMLADLVQRAHIINSDETDLCFKIGVLVVFGSFMDERQQVLGDLDVAFREVHRYPLDGAEGRSPLREARKRSVERARQAGRHHDLVGLNDIFWPYKEFLLALKARSPGLSLHTFDQDKKVVLSGPHKVIFGTLPPPEEDEP